MGNVAHDARLSHDSHAQHDTHDEEHLLDGSILQHAWNAAGCHLVGLHELTVKGLVDDPKHGEHTQRAKERRQFGDVVEGGNKPQAANAHDEHHEALPAVQSGVVATIWRCHPLGIEPGGQHLIY